MAIEWIVEDGRPVAPGDLLRSAEEIAANLLGGTRPVLAAEGTASGRPWSQPLGTPGQTSAELHVGFAVDVEARLGTTVGRFEITSDVQIDDDGSRSADTVYGGVTAFRTQVSAVLALAAAVGFAKLSRGELSGTGLQRRHQWHDTDALIVRLAAGLPPDCEPATRIRRVADLIGCGELPYS